LLVVHMDGVGIEKIGKTPLKISLDYLDDILILYMVISLLLKMELSALRNGEKLLVILNLFIAVKVRRNR
jgi:surface polysaccharide O-acyltransferase-like enzyme